MATLGSVTLLNRILVVRNDRIGDLVLTLPTLAALRHSFPTARLTLLASRYAGPMLAGYPLIDEILLDDRQQSAWQLGQRLAVGRYDAALVINTNTRNSLAVRLAGIPQRVCWARKPAGWWASTAGVTLRRSHPPIHEADFALAFAAKLGAEVSPTDAVAPKLSIDPATRTRVAQRIAQTLGTTGPLFGVHPGNKQSAYNWPPTRYAQLVGQLAQLGRVMVTGSPQEQPLLDLIARSLSEPQLGRVGFFTDFQLPELAAALEQQTTLVVSSTGPMHLAALMDTPVVALFSPHPAHVPAKWAPLGPRHKVLVAPLAPGEDPHVPRSAGTDLMARIRVEEVLQSALSFVPAAQRPAAQREVA